MITIVFFFSVAYESGVPVLFEPVSVVKSSRIAPIAEHVSAKDSREHHLNCIVVHIAPFNH
jgi:hypothetical protein